MAVTPELYDTIIRIVDQRLGEIKVTREDFDQLTKTVVEAQRRTNEKLEALVEAQGRTDVAIRELAEAQKQTDGTLRELAGEQKRTDAALRELAEGQRRTDGTVRELAGEQKRTDGALRELAESQKDLARSVGRLSDTVGYGLEDVARVMLPPWLARHERVRVDDLDRRFIQADGETVEVNLYGEGVKGKRPVMVIGEAKSRIHAGDVKEFAGNVEKLRGALGRGKVLPVMFGYWIHPSASSLAETLHIRVVASYQR